MVKFEHVDIEHHSCSDAELGLDDSGESKFDPLNEETKQELKRMRPYFRCFDHKDVVISNNL